MRDSFNHQELIFQGEKHFGKNIEAQTIPVVPKLDKPNSDYHKPKQPLSPREFLRQTIMGQHQNKNPLLTLRARQKGPRKMKN